MMLRCCPDHEDLMRELALGRLDDAEGKRAEAVRETCTACRAWWLETFNEQALAVIDTAVADAFTGFAPPRRRWSGWWAVAAAAVLGAGIAASTLLWRGGGEVPVAVGPANGTGSDVVVSVWDFEDGTLDLAANAPRVETEASGHRDPSQAVFNNDLESGDLSSWSSHS
jgi:hypothetical protein